MKQTPLLHQAQGSGAEVTLDHLAIINTDHGLIGAVFGVEVGWRMIVVIHGDDDPEEARQFRHGSVAADGMSFSRWLRQRLHIDLAGEQAGQEQVAGAAEVFDLTVKTINQLMQRRHIEPESIY